MAFAAVFLSPLFASHAAADPPEHAPDRTGEWQVWSGADVSSNVWLLYSGVTYSPWSRMHEEGLKLRAAGGYGEYKYEKDPDHPEFVDPDRPLKFQARTYYADFLVGYLMRFGELTAKAFVGPSVVSHDVSPMDEFNVTYGDEIGVKGVLELWLNMGEHAWGSLDLSWTSAHETRAARTRVGYRVWPKLSIGLEGAINLDAQGECRMKAGERHRCRNGAVDPEGKPYDDYRAKLMDYARVGGFVRYELESGEVSLSVGALGDEFARSGDTEVSPYVTVNWLTQF